MLLFLVYLKEKKKKNYLTPRIPSLWLWANICKLRVYFLYSSPLIFKFWSTQLILSTHRCIKWLSLLDCDFVASLFLFMTWLVAGISVCYTILNRTGLKKKNILVSVCTLYFPTTCILMYMKKIYQSISTETFLLIIAFL